MRSRCTIPPLARAAVAEFIGTFVLVVSSVHEVIVSRKLENLFKTFYCRLLAVAV